MSVLNLILLHSLNNLAYFMKPLLHYNFTSWVFDLVYLLLKSTSIVEFHDYKAVIYRFHILIKFNCIVSLDGSHNVNLVLHIVPKIDQVSLIHVFNNIVFVNNFYDAGTLIKITMTHIHFRVSSFIKLLSDVHCVILKSNVVSRQLLLPSTTL